MGWDGDGMRSISKQALNRYRQCANCIGYALAALGLVRTDHPILFEWDNMDHPPYPIL